MSASAILVSMPRSRGSVFLLVASAIGWAACVGDDPSFGPATGERLGDCFANNTCNGGLECRLPERICLVPGEPVPPGAGRDGGGDDSAVVDSSAGGPADSTTTDGTATDGGAQCVSSSSPVREPRCGVAATPPCPANEGCCVDTSSAVCSSQAGCPMANRFIACDNGGCGAGDLVCCLESNVAVGVGPSCATLSATKTVCYSNACPQAMHTFCSTDGDCAGDLAKPNCRLVEVDIDAPFKPVWKICVP